MIPETHLPTVADAGNGKEKIPFLRRIGLAMHDIYKTATGKFFIQAMIMQPPTPAQLKEYGAQFKGTVLTKRWLKYDAKTGLNDFMESPHEATCFDAILGHQIARDLKKLFADMPNADFELVEANAVITAYSMQNGTAAEPQPAREGFQNMVEHAHREYAQVKITSAGVEYLKENFQAGVSTPADILFLVALSDRHWHSVIELAKRQLPDFKGILVSAKENGLIEAM